MVTKKSRIAQNPKAKINIQEAEQWINQGGTDPEIIIEANAPSQNEPAADNQQGKKYPHRISFDLDNPQYKRLKYAAFDSDRSMNEILREAVEEWMKARSY